jgi:hypothetical protein
MRARDWLVFLLVVFLAFPLAVLAALWDWGRREA